MILTEPIKFICDGKDCFFSLTEVVAMVKDGHHLNMTLLNGQGLTSLHLQKNGHSYNGVLTELTDYLLLAQKTEPLGATTKYPVVHKPDVVEKPDPVVTRRDYTSPFKPWELADELGVSKLGFKLLLKAYFKRVDSEGEPESTGYQLAYLRRKGNPIDRVYQTIDKLLEKKLLERDEHKHDHYFATNLLTRFFYDRRDIIHTDEVRNYIFQI